MKRPLVSIIIPAYNSESTIGRCLQSIVGQSYGNLEVLVLDDGSTDDTVRVAMGFSSPLIKIIKLRHAGVSAVRNHGIKKSTGKYIMFVDADDTIATTTVEQLVNYAESNHADVVKFGFNTVKRNKFKPEKYDCIIEGGIDLGKKENYEMVRSWFYDQQRNIPCYTPTLFLKREFVIKHDLYYDERLVMMEDAVYYLSLLKTGTTIYFWNKYLYNVFVNPKSATRSRKNMRRAYKGALESSSIIINEMAWKQSVLRRYTKIIVGMLLRSDVISVEDIQNKTLVPIVTKVDMSEDSLFWRTVRAAILNKRMTRLRLLAGVYKIKRKIGEII